MDDYIIMEYIYYFLCHEYFLIKVCFTIEKSNQESFIKNEIID